MDLKVRETCAVGSGHFHRGTFLLYLAWAAATSGPLRCGGATISGLYHCYDLICRQGLARDVRRQPSRRIAAPPVDRLLQGGRCRHFPAALPQLPGSCSRRDAGAGHGNTLGYRTAAHSAAAAAAVSNAQRSASPSESRRHSVRLPPPPPLPAIVFVNAFKCTTVCYGVPQLLSMHV